jgi:hypothetical protein
MIVRDYCMLLRDSVTLGWVLGRSLRTKLGYAEVYFDPSKLQLASKLALLTG